MGIQPSLRSGAGALGTGQQKVSGRQKCQGVFSWEEEVYSNLEPPQEVESNHKTAKPQLMEMTGDEGRDGEKGGSDVST